MAPKKKLRTTPQRAALDRAIKQAGGIVAAAEKLGVTVSAIGYWRKKGLPPERVREIETLTGVPRAELRPDLFA
jgi:DNA-binding transcriptional regulator YdaS (Cro superfamily)